MRKKMSCSICPKRDSCQYLCDSMNEIIANTRAKNNIYADNTIANKEKPKSTTLENIFFSTGLSAIERRDATRIIIAIISPEHKKILDLYSTGLTQEGIAKNLGVTQACISRKFKTIKNIINGSFIEIIPHIV